MSQWNIISTTDDIDDLLKQYLGFHDSVLVDLHFQSGVFSENKTTYYGSPEDHILHMVFHSPWYQQPLELCFTGVRKFHIAGWQDNYSCEIFDCHLDFHTDLIVGRDDPLIVWADWSGFSAKNYTLEHIMHEPMDSFVIANSLKWRFLEGE